MLTMISCTFFSGLIGCVVFLGLRKIFYSHFETLQIVVPAVFAASGAIIGYFLNQPLVLFFPADKYEIEERFIEPVKSSDGHETAYLFIHKKISGETIVQFVQKTDNFLHRCVYYYKENEIWNLITFLPEDVDMAFVQVKKTYKRGVWGLFLMYPNKTTFFVPAHGIKDGGIRPREGYEFFHP